MWILTTQLDLCLESDIRLTIISRTALVSHFELHIFVQFFVSELVLVCMERLLCFRFVEILMLAEQVPLIPGKRFTYLFIKRWERMLSG